MSDKGTLDQIRMSSEDFSDWHLRKAAMVHQSRYHPTETVIHGKSLAYYGRITS